MRKIAVFVEGQTELITIRNFLLQKYNYEVNVDCLKFFGHSLHNVPYQHNSPNAVLHYQIVDVGNDVRVPSTILEQEQSLWNAGFEKIVGLRDMYSKEYRGYSSMIDAATHQLFFDAASTVIKKAKQPEKITICFSIMEVEAWYLAMPAIFSRMDVRITPELIEQTTGFDLSVIDPETEVFHPANIMDQVYSIAGLDYDKSRGTIESLCSYITTEDYKLLYNSTVCGSFNIFHDHICVN